MTRETTDSLIDEIVREVLSQLRERSGSASASTNGDGKSKVASPQQVQSTSIELTEKVITEELLKNKAKPGVAVRILGSAILTPTARDYIKTHRISVHRNQSIAVSKTASRGDSQGLIIASHLPPVVESLLAGVRKSGNAYWRVEIAGGLSEVVARSQSAICRGESGQTLVLAKAPHNVACLVNRSADCRAAVVRSAADVRLVREELAANVLCVDLAQSTYTGLRGVLLASMETSPLVQSLGRNGA